MIGRNKAMIMGKCVRKCTLRKARGKRVNSLGLVVGSNLLSAALMIGMAMVGLDVASARLVFCVMVIGNVVAAVRNV